MNVIHSAIDTILPYAISLLECMGIIIVIWSAIYGFWQYIQNTFMKKELNGIFKANVGSLAASLMVLPQIKKLKNTMDYHRYGGAPFLGISRPVIKAHGSSKATSIKCCIAQAKDYAHSGIIQEYAKMAANPDAYKKKVETAETESQEAEQ